MNSSTVYYTSPREYNIVSINYVRCLTTYFLFDQVPDIWWPTPRWKRIDRRILIVAYTYILKYPRPSDSDTDVAAPCELYIIQNLIPKREIGFLDIFQSRVDYIYYNKFTGRWIKSV